MKSSLKIYFAVGIGGMIGSSLRYLLSLFTNDNYFNSFPFATFSVNIIGAFLLTLLLYSPTFTKKGTPIIFQGVTTGLIGSFTTFSTIQLETVLLLKHNFILGILYIISTLFFGLICSYAGYYIAKRLNGKRVE